MRDTELYLNDIATSLLNYCLSHQWIPLFMDENILHVASHELLTPQQEDSLRFISQRQIKQQQWSTQQIEDALQRVSIKLQQQIDKQEKKVENQQQANDFSEENIPGEYVVQFINHIIQQSLQQRASDIHFEPYAQYYRIRIRVDGVLNDLASPPLTISRQIIARLKVMAKLDIAEQRLPQDGQINIQQDEQQINMRLSTLPVIHGEKAVLRIMESGDIRWNIEQLHMSDADEQNYLSALHAPQGVILVTGPTGSGKTVTLYSGLSRLNSKERNICTIEDPIEIELAGINQTQINDRINLSFSQVLRALLRQDPDVIMLGEIRDRETAEIAIEAGQTGHLVLSTLHTNSTIETLNRLQQMGIAHYLLASSLRLIIAQRLVRQLCRHCRQPGKETIMIDTRGDSQHQKISHWVAVGCQHCYGGYKGRCGVYELLLITEEIKQAILDKMTFTQIEQIALQQSMKKLSSAGLELVIQGKTSMAELHRVLGKQTEFIGCYDAR